MHRLAADSDKPLAVLVAPPGYGKSTLVQHFNGLLRPTSGSVIVDGIDVDGKSADRMFLRKRAGFMRMG